MLWLVAKRCARNRSSRSSPTRGLVTWIHLPADDSPSGKLLGSSGKVQPEVAETDFRSVGPAVLRR